MKNDIASKKRGKRNKPEVDESEAAFHFIAFVPIDGTVWKLDGLERQPQKMGSIECEDWVYQVKPDIEARMAQYEEGQIEFSILSLVKEPLPDLISSLTHNVKSIITVSAKLDALQADWKDYTTESEDRLIELTITGPEPTYGLTEDMIDRSSRPPPVEESIKSNETLVLIELWRKLVMAQAGLRASIKEEQESIQSDQKRAASRRFDYGPAVHQILQSLARKQIIRPLLDYGKI